MRKADRDMSDKCPQTEESAFVTLKVYQCCTKVRLKKYK